MVKEKKEITNILAKDDIPLLPDLGENISGWSNLHRLIRLFIAINSPEQQEEVIRFAAKLIEKQKKKK